jgi:hypothetical protein
MTYPEYKNSEFRRQMVLAQKCTLSKLEGQAEVKREVQFISSVNK